MISTLPKASDDYITVTDRVRPRLERELKAMRELAQRNNGIAACERAFLIREELEWREFFDAETIPSVHNSLEHNILANTDRNQMSNKLVDLCMIMYVEICQNGQTRKADRYLRYAQDVNWLIFMEVN